MYTMPLVRFADDNESRCIGINLKLERCPHCGKTGMLIRHGFLRGYNEYRERMIKAQRIFCSNRNNRSGCGKTFSCYRVHRFPHIMMTTNAAWTFLSHILSGNSIESAYHELDTAIVLTLSSFFRFWSKFLLAMPRIRTHLAHTYRLSAVSELSPPRETIRHITLHLSDKDANPVTRYQHIFQHSFI